MIRSDLTTETRTNEPERTAVDASRAFAAALAVLLCLTLVGSAVAGASAADGDAVGEDDPAFEVVLDADGDAEVIVRSTYDLDDDEERAAFESLEDDDEAKDAALERFENRMDSVADASGDRLDRDVQVSNPAIALWIADGGDVGVVEIRLIWEGIAAVEGDAVILTEPFASGFTPDRTLVVTAPEGYEIVEAEPKPDEEMATSVSWETGTDLEGFTVTAEAAADAGESDDAAETDGADEDDGLPGFGPVATLLAALGTFAWLGRRTKGG